MRLRSTRCAALTTKGEGMTKASIRRAWAIALGISLICLVWGSEAEAKNPEKVFRGQIVTSSKRIPASAKSKNAYIKKLKKLRTKKFWENKKKKSWKIYYAAFFRKALNDLEVTVKLYDITNGKKKLVNSYEQYLSTRGEKSIISNITLEREFFGVNKQILMVMSTRSYILCSTKFHILGEAEKYSGEVNFEDDETD